jgi:hypothetical protein
LNKKKEHKKEYNKKNRAIALFLFELKIMIIAQIAIENNG